MKINSKELLSGLKKVSPAIGSNKIVPICEYVKIEGDGDTANLYATNLNLSCITSIDLLEPSNECILIPFVEIEKLCYLTSEIEVDKTLRVSFGDEYCKLGEPEDAKNFPSIPSFDDAISFSADGDFFFSLTQAMKSTDSSSLAPCHNVFLESVSGEVTIFSYGNFALYVDRIMTIDKKVLFSISIPPDFVKATKNMSDAVIYISDNKIKAEDIKGSVICALADCNVLGYRAVYEKTDRTPNCSFNKEELLTAISKLEAVRTSENFCKISFLFSGNKITLTTSDTTLNSDGKSYCACNSELKDVLVMFNAAIIKSAISQINSPIINIRVVDSDTTPIMTHEKVSVFVSHLAEIKK